MLKVKVNETIFSINEAANWDLIESGSTFHILKDNKSFRCLLLKKDETGKNLLLSINDTVYQVNIQDQYDVLLEQLGMSDLSVKKMKDIKAPMPGLVLDIKISVGDELKEGDTLLVLEAMKMENMLKSPGSGTVKAIKVKKGEAVEKGQILVEIV